MSARLAFALSALLAGVAWIARERQHACTCYMGFDHHDCPEGVTVCGARADSTNDPGKGITCLLCRLVIKRWAVNR